MGGYGSGARWSSKSTTEDYLQIDLRSLKKEWLAPGANSILRWTRRQEEIGSIALRYEPDRLILHYTHGKSSGSQTQQEYPVYLDRTPCHYGGQRLWFLCPASGCGRRVLILYGGKIFACRQCYRLAYESQRESRGERADARSWKIRERCGGWGSLLDPLFRRKGMHHRTFERLARDYERACSESDFAFITKMGMSMDEVIRLRG